MADDRAPWTSSDPDRVQRVTRSARLDDLEPGLSCRGVEFGLPDTRLTDVGDGDIACHQKRHAVDDFEGPRRRL